MDPARRQKGPKLKNYLVEMTVVNNPFRKFTGARVYWNDVRCKTQSVVTVWNATD